MAVLQATEIQGPSTGYGILPVGAIIPMTTLTGAYALPSSGVVDDSGWMRCNGAAIPAGNTLSGSTPDLTDGRFLRGYSTAGTTGGATSVTLATTNLPAHTHTGPAHTHTIDHNHPSTASGTGSANHYHNLANPGTRQVNSSTYMGFLGRVGFDYNLASDSSAAPNQTRSASTGAAHTHSTDLPNYTGNSGSSGTGDTGSTGDGTAFSIVPQYLNVIYLIRVK